MPDRFIVYAEVAALVGESCDIIDQLTSEVQLEFRQPSGRIAHLLLQVVPTVAQRVDTFSLVTSHGHL